MIKEVIKQAAFEKGHTRGGKMSIRQVALFIGEPYQRMVDFFNSPKGNIAIAEKLLKAYNLRIIKIMDQCNNSENQ